MANTTIKKTGINYMLVCNECGTHLATASEERFLPKTTMCPNCDADMLSRIKNFNNTRGHLYTTKRR